MSIISCTSPSASDPILPASSVTRWARSALAARSSSPSRRTSSPRRGAGVARQARNASWAAMTARSTEAGLSSCASAMVSPVTGERTGRLPPVQRLSATPRRASTSAASARAEPIWVCRVMQLLGGAQGLVFRSVEASEAVRQEIGERDVLLADEAGGRQLAVGQHVEHRADRAGCGDLDGALHLAGHGLGVDLVDVGLLHQSAVLQSA